MALTKEQLEVIKHGKGNILVSASAGSGKTHTMIERLKRLIIEERVGVNEILAVTFTEAAAADMKEKLKDALSCVLDGEWNDLYGERNEEKVAWCEKQLAEIATADICTMHAFCGRLIRTYFFLLGVAPDFKILDQADAGVLRAISVDKAFKEFYDQEDALFLTLVDRHAKGRTDKNLKELVLSAYAFCDSEANPKALLEKYKSLYEKDGYDALLIEYKKLFDGQLNTLIEEVYGALKIVENSGLVKGTAFAKALYADMQTVVLRDNFYDLKGYENYKLKLDFERNLDPENLEQKAILANARDKFAKLLKRFLKCIGENIDGDISRLQTLRAHTEKLSHIIVRFKQIYSQEKRDENALDFNDLEHFALEILNDENICNSVKERYKYLFVDEYQDTNGVQEEIINKIACDNLFMVGDVKQSIYGFRGCRSEFFINKEKLMTERGQKVVRLNANFRSADAVIKHVNAIFNYCMTESVYGENYKENSELKAGKDVYPEEYAGRCELHFLQKEESEKKQDEQPRIYDVLKEKPENKETDVSHLAGLIAGVIKKELTEKFYDPKKKEFRKINYGDIAILTRSRKKELASCLIKHGLPIATDVADNVCDFPEIQVMINALKLIDCFSQDLPLVSTLKSPIGGFSEEELLSVVRFYEDNNDNPHGGFFDAFEFYLSAADTSLKNRLYAFKQYIDGVRLIADFVGAHGVLEKLVLDKSLEAYLLAEKGGVAKADRLKKFLASTVSGGKALSVSEFLSRVKNCPDAFGLQPFTQEDTIRLMTVHSSKGLEFPVVILCNLEASFNSEDDYDEIMLDRNLGLAVKFYDDNLREKHETLVRSVIRERARIERMKEEMRLFYVATTRATYSMHLIFSGKEDGRKNIFNGANACVDFLPSFIPAKLHTVEEIELSRRNADFKEVLIGVAEKDKVDGIKSCINYDYPFMQDCTLPLKGSVTALTKDDEENNYTRVLFEDESTDSQKGTIAHKLLENFNFDESIIKTAERLITLGVLSREEVDKINLERIDRAINSDALKGLKGKKLYREQPFLVNIPANKVFDTDSDTSVLVQGVIDLLAVGDGGAEIIDYKYSSLNAESMQKRYRDQVNLYAYAAETVLNIKVIKKTLVNIFTGEVAIIQ